MTSSYEKINSRVDSLTYEQLSNFILNWTCNVYCVEIGNVYVDAFIVSCNAMGKDANLIWENCSCFNNSIVDYTKLHGCSCI